MTYQGIDSLGSKYPDWTTGTPAMSVGDEVHLGFEYTNSQTWVESGNCDFADSIKDKAQQWGPMSYLIHRDSIDTTCYLIKADPLDNGTPTGTFASS